MKEGEPRRKRHQEKKIIRKDKTKRFMRTYRKKKSILGWAFGICKDISELERFADSVYVR